MLDLCNKSLFFFFKAPKHHQKLSNDKMEARVYVEGEREVIEAEGVQTLALISLK